MRKIIAKISGILATLGAIAMMLADLFPEEGYVIFWIGVVTVVICGIAYLATGEKPRDWFWELLG